MAFKLNPRFLAELEQQAGVRAAMTAAAVGVANRAEAIGQRVDDDYEVTVEQTARGVRVRAHGGPLNPAAWMEFGTGHPGPTPAYAPLRRGAQAMGLRLKASKL